MIQPSTLLELPAVIYASCANLKANKSPGKSNSTVSNNNPH